MPYMEPRRFRASRQISVLAGVLAMGLLQHGCLAAAWVAVVGTDSMRTSHVTFAPFEASWVSEERPTAITEGASLTSVAVLPVEGDVDMGEHLVQILQRQTALRVESSEQVGQELNGSQFDEANRAIVAKEVSRALAVDAVLFGRVTDSPARPSDWGWKEEQSRRLFVYLVDRDGRLLWKDELPFTVVTGSKPPLEGAAETALSQHLMDHVRDLGLDALGYLPHKTS